MTTLFTWPKCPSCPERGHCLICGRVNVPAPLIPERDAADLEREIVNARQSADPDGYKGDDAA